MSCLLPLISFVGNVIYLQIIHQCEVLQFLKMMKLTAICIFRCINQLNNDMYVKHSGLIILHLHAFEFMD